MLPTAEQYISIFQTVYNYDVHAKFEVTQPICCRLIANQKPNWTKFEESEWVSSILTMAHHHIWGSSVPENGVKDVIK